MLSFGRRAMAIHVVRTKPEEAMRISHTEWLIQKRIVPRNPGGRSDGACCWAGSAAS